MFPYKSSCQLQMFLCISASASVSLHAVVSEVRQCLLVDVQVSDINDRIIYVHFTFWCVFSATVS